MSVQHPTVPASVSDPVNAAILAVSEDRLSGFQEDPFGAIAERSGVPVETVIERIVAMLAGRHDPPRAANADVDESCHAVRLCAWQVPSDRLDAAFDYMFKDDPFSGHVVIRTTESVTPGSSYRLWTTLKVPQGYSLRKACGVLGAQSRRGELSIDAGQNGFCAGRRPRTPPRARARRTCRRNG